MPEAPEVRSALPTCVPVHARAYSLKSGGGSGLL